MATKKYQLASKEAIQMAEFFGFELIELTPAYFSDEELSAALFARNYTVLKPNILINTGNSICVHKEKTLADFSNMELINSIKLREKSDDEIRLLYSDHMNKIVADLMANNAHEKGRQLGYEAGKREAFISISDLRKAATSFNLKLLDTREILEIQKYNYDAGKRDAFDSFNKKTAATQSKWLRENVKHIHDQAYEKGKHDANLKPESRCVCAQCGDKSPEGWPENLGDRSKFCSEECRDNFAWVDAEFPRDYMKKGRMFLKTINSYKYNIIIFGFINNEFWVRDSEDQGYYGPKVQVRRDSVEVKS